MTYEELLNKTAEEGIEIFENHHIGKLKGLYLDDTITLNSNLENNTEKRCVLAEELGHHYTTVGDIMDQSKIENRKQERLARVWAYERLVGIINLVDAYKNGIRNRFELAEHLEVTETFIDEALRYYKEKYGICYELYNYIIYFDPLIVMEKF